MLKQIVPLCHVVASKEIQSFCWRNRQLWFYYLELSLMDGYLYLCHITGKKIQHFFSFQYDFNLQNVILLSYDGNDDSQTHITHRCQGHLEPEA